MKPPESRGGVEPLLTAADVARILRLSVRSIRRLIAEDELPVIRVGRSVRVRPEDLRSFLDASGQERPGGAQKSQYEDQ
jgi:excisionase family DNA binding protein